LEFERRRSGSLALIILTGLNVLNYADRYVGAAVLPLLLSDLSLSDAEGGILQSAFIVVYTFASPVAGWWGDRRARLPIAAVGVLVWSAAVVTSGFAPTYVLLLVARAVTGAGEAAYAVVTPSVLSDLFPPERRGRALATFYAAMPVGAALGYALGGALGAHWGWRLAFVVVGAPGIPLAWCLVRLGEPARGAFDEARGDISTPLTLRASLRALGSRPSYVVNTVAQVLYTFAVGGLATWMPTYFLRERHVPLAPAAASFGAILMLAGLGGTLLGGQLGDWATARRRAGHFIVSGWSLVASLAFTVLGVIAPMPVVYWPAMFVALFLLFVNVGPLNAAMANVLPADLRTRGFAVTTMLIHLFGDAASPWLIGLASDRVGLAAPILASGALLAVSGVILLAGKAALERDLWAAGTPGPALPPEAPRRPAE